MDALTKKYPLLPMALCVSVALLSSCTIFPIGPEPDESPGSKVTEYENSEGEIKAEPDDSVIQNLVLALEQIFSPAMMTTVQVSRSDLDPMMKRVAKSLLNEGFGVQMVGGDQGTNQLSATRDSVDDQRDDVFRYTIGIGDVSVARSYALEAGGGYVPITKLFVAGTLKNIVVDDSMFSDMRTVEYLSDGIVRLSSQGGRSRVRLYR